MLCVVCCSLCVVGLLRGDPVLLCVIGLLRGDPVLLCVIGLLSGEPVCCVMCVVCVGLLRGHPVPYGDRHPGAAHPADPAVVPEGHLPPGVRPQGPGPHEGQVRAPTPHLHPGTGLGGGFSFRVRV